MHLSLLYVLMCLHIVVVGLVRANTLQLVTGETSVTLDAEEKVVEKVEEEGKDVLVGEGEKWKEEDKLITDVSLITDWNIETVQPREGSTRDDTPSMWSVDAVPDPRIDVWECGNHGNSSNICNPDHVLTSQQVATLDALIDALWSNITGPCSGAGEEEDSYHITIVILTKIALEEQVSISAVTHTTVAPQNEPVLLGKFTEHLRREKFHHERWCGNDMLILLATQQNFIYTATGPASSVVLTNECVNGIYVETKPLFQAQQWMEGLDALIRAYGGVFHGNHDCSDRVGYYFTVIGLSIFGLLALCCCSLWFREACRHSSRPDPTLYQIPEEQSWKGLPDMRNSPSFSAQRDSSPWWLNVPRKDSMTAGV